MLQQHKNRQILHDVFVPVLQKRFFRMIAQSVGAIAAAFLGVAALVGWLFNTPVLFTICGFVLFASLLVIYGPVLDRALEMQVEKAMSAVTTTFNRIPLEQQDYAIAHLLAQSDATHSRQLQVQPDGHLLIIFKVKES